MEGTSQKITAEELEQGIPAAGQAVVEEIIQSRGGNVGEEEIELHEEKKKKTFNALEDPATRVAFVAGLFSLLVTLLNALLG